MIENTLQKIVKHLKMRFPASQISNDLNYSKSAISQFLNNKKEISEKFKEQFEEFYNIKFSDFEDNDEEIALSEEERKLLEAHDYKINEVESEIKIIKEKITEQRARLIEDKENEDEYHKIIKLYNNRIILYEERRNIIEQAKNDTLEEILRNKK